MTTEHKIADPVLAIPCWAIYADYDANAPDSATLLVVATEELAKEVCRFLNEDPRRWQSLAFCDGWEWCKRFRCSQTYRLSPEGIATHFETLVASLEATEAEDDEAEEAEG